MTSRLTELGADCTDPPALARFWCDVLGYVVLEEDPDSGTVTIGPRADAGRGTGPIAPVLTFARVPEPKSVKNRLHLDVSPDGDQDAEVERLIDLGASRIDVGQAEDVSWVVLADPEGNEFCVLGGRAGE